MKSESVDHFRTRRVLLETEPELSVNVDGELVARTPEEFAVAPNALRVIVPQNFYHHSSRRYGTLIYPAFSSSLRRLTR